MLFELTVRSLLCRILDIKSISFAMGSADVASTLTELNVQLDDPVYVKPAEPCENTSPFFLTNIDQVCTLSPSSRCHLIQNGN